MLFSMIALPRHQAELESEIGTDMARLGTDLQLFIALHIVLIISQVHATRPTTVLLDSLSFIACFLTPYISAKSSEVLFILILTDQSIDIDAHRLHDDNNTSFTSWCTNRSGILIAFGHLSD